MAHLHPLRDQVAVVTGASRGIGRAIAIECGRLGAHVVLNYCHNQEAARAAEKELLAAGAASVETIQADISIVNEAQRLIESTLSKHRKVDILVNNAAIERVALLHNMTDTDWHDVLDVNLSAVFYLCRAVLPVMLEMHSGHIVNIASASSYIAHRGASSYVASKHGLIGLTKALALETANKGIKVNAVAPGCTDTDMLHDLTDVQREKLLKMVPMGRIASTDEVAKMVAFIVTQANYSTGNVFHISGGAVMG